MNPILRGVFPFILSPVCVSFFRLQVGLAAGMGLWSGLHPQGRAGVGGGGGSGGLAAQSCPTLRPHGLQPTRLLCPWDLPGENTGVGCYFLLQRIFPTLGLNLHLLHWLVDSLLMSHWRSLVGGEKGH